MRGSYNHHEVLKWQYKKGITTPLVGFTVNSKETFTPQICKVTVVNDIFSLSLFWSFDLNKLSTHLPGLTYEIIVHYFFTTEKSIDRNDSSTLIQHSLQIAFDEFNKRKAETLFRNHELKVHIDKEALLNCLFSYLMKQL
jgi:hypothetical protein